MVVDDTIKRFIPAAEVPNIIIGRGAAHWLSLKYQYSRQVV